MNLLEYVFFRVLYLKESILLFSSWYLWVCKCVGIHCISDSTSQLFWMKFRISSFLFDNMFWIIALCFGLEVEKLSVLPFDKVLTVCILSTSFLQGPLAGAIYGRPPNFNHLWVGQGFFPQVHSTLVFEPGLRGKWTPKPMYNTLAFPCMPPMCIIKCYYLLG